MRRAHWTEKNQRKNVTYQISCIVSRNLSVDVTVSACDNHHTMIAEHGNYIVEDCRIKSGDIDRLISTCRIVRW